MQNKYRFSFHLIVLLFICFSFVLSILYSTRLKPLSIYSKINTCYSKEDCIIRYYIDLTEYIEKNIRISIIFSTTDRFFSVNQIYYSISESFDYDPINLRKYNKTYSDTSGIYYYLYEIEVFPTLNQKYFVFQRENYDYSVPITVQLKSISYPAIICNNSNNSDDDYSHFWETTAGGIVLGIIAICLCLRVDRLCCPSQRP